jgi:hypothetical protein
LYEVIAEVLVDVMLVGAVGVDVVLIGKVPRTARGRAYRSVSISNCSVHARIADTAVDSLRANAEELASARLFALHYV